MNHIEQKAIVKWIKIVVLKTLKEKNLTRLDTQTLIGAGMLGYSQARLRFDASLGFKFKTFAEYRIKGAVLDEVRKMIGDERVKTPRPRKVEDYDYEMMSDDQCGMDHLESSIDVENLLDASMQTGELSDRDVQVIQARIEGLSLREISQRFQFSESRASQVLGRIKKTMWESHREELGIKFNLAMRVCPLCQTQNVVSDKSREFRCDGCDVNLAIGSDESIGPKEENEEFLESEDDQIEHE